MPTRVFKRARRTVTRKRSARPRPLRRVTRGSKFGFRIQPHSFHRYCLPISGNVGTSGGTYSASTGILSTSASVTELDFGQQFTLSDVPNQSEFSNLFDYYKLSKVIWSIKMIPNVDSSYNPSAQPATATFYPSLWYVLDQDDVNNTTLAALREYEGVRKKVLRSNQECKIVLRPTPLIQTYNTSLTTGYAIGSKKQWLDMAYPGIPHFGLKGAIDFEGITLPAAAGAFTFKINVKYYFKCKSVR